MVHVENYLSKHNFSSHYSGSHNFGNWRNCVAEK